MAGTLSLPERRDCFDVAGESSWLRRPTSPLDGSSVHLEKYSVRGFRSLTNVVDIPVSTPTILAGPNDGGKTAALHALAFLLREYSPTDDDRSYLPQEPGSRCEVIEVRGHFRLDEGERKRFDLSEEVELRRIVVGNSQPRFEIWAPVPDDEDLRHLGNLLVPELKALAARFGIRVPNPTKPKLLVALRAYATDHSSGFGWVELPSGLDDRLPRLASFEGHTLEPEAAVRSALALRFKGYVADETVRGHVRELEVAAQDWLGIQAKPLADHIVKRCPDIASVTVEPVVSFAPNLKSTSLHLERTSGERVRLDRSGLGSSRRISMAVWEATSDLLAEQTHVDANLSDLPPVQVIVVYDEPDTHLDYHYQREVMRLIREQANVPHVSVVVATHSMNLIDGVDIRDVVLLHLDDDRRTTMQRLGSGEHAEFDRHLGLIATAVGLRNSVLLHERCFFAVEGDTEQLAIPVLFTLSEGMSLQAAGVALWACGGNDGALNLARYLHKHGRSVLLMVDADSQTQNRMFSTPNLQRIFAADYDDIVVMVGQEQGVNELEELFDDATWARTANQAWPRAGGWTPEHFAAIRTGKKFSDQVRRLVREHSADAPAGKPAILFELAVRLERPTDVPEPLRDVFGKLRQLAG